MTSHQEVPETERNTKSNAFRPGTKVPGPFTLQQIQRCIDRGSMHIEILIGLIGGILIGGTGAGVGSLITPLLILAGYRPAVAVSTGLGTLALSKLTGATLHHQLGNWPDRNVGIVVAGGAAGVVLTWLLTRSIVLTAAQQDSALKIMLGVTLVLAAISLQISNRDGHHGLIRDLEHRPGVLFVIGALVAFIVATTAAGSAISDEF